MKVGFNMLLWTTHVTKEHLPLLKTLKKVGYDGVEIPVFGGDAAHFEKIGKAIKDNGLACTTVTVIPDEQHNPISADPKCRKQAANSAIQADRAAKKLGVKVVNGFTGSSIWHMLYLFPPTSPTMALPGYDVFAKRSISILDGYKAEGVKFGLEVHPTDIAFDTASAQSAIEAVKSHESFGLNYDPSHLGYQAVDCVKFIRTLEDRIFHRHIQHVWWGDGDGTVGVFGGNVAFSLEARDIQQFCARSKTWTERPGIGIKRREPLSDGHSRTRATPPPREPQSRSHAAGHLKPPRYIFVIAHQEVYWRELEQMLMDNFDVTPLVLQEQPDRGASTIIEKFEAYARKCCYAVAVLTPDDSVQNNGNVELRARPNILFELGWLARHLGRDRIMMLVQEGTDLTAFSDFHGVLHRTFKSHISEVFKEIMRELASARLQ